MRTRFARLGSVWALGAACAVGWGWRDASAAPSTVKGRSILSTGESLHEIAWRRSITSTREGGEPQTSELRQRLVLRLTPEDPEAALRGSATGEPVVFVGSVERIALGLMLGEDSVIIERPKVTLEEEPDTPAAKALIAMAGALGAAEIRLVVVPSEGVARVSGLDGVAEAIAHEPTAPNLVGLFAPAEFARALSPIFGACGGAKEQDPAQGWSSEETGDLGPGGSIILRTAWSREEAPGPMLRFRGVTTATIDRGEQPDPAAPTFSLDSQASPSVLEWDGERDVLIRVEHTRAMKAKASLGPNQFSLALESELSVTRVKQPE